MKQKVFKIKGAGIAGLSYGIDKLKEGYQVEIADFSLYKDKLCGGILTDKAYVLLSNYIKVPIINDIHFVKIFNKKKFITKIDCIKRPIKIINRKEIDEKLVEKFLKLGGKYCEPDNSLKYDIDASGCTEEKSGLCLSGKVDTQYNEISIIFGYVDNGYCWVIPNKGYSNIGIGISQDFHNDRDIRNAFTKFLIDFGFNGVIRNIKGHKIPCRVNDKGNNIGDSLGAINFLTGEGIYSALCRNKKELKLRAFTSKILYEIFYFCKPICLLLAKNKMIQDLVLKYIQGGIKC